MSGRRSEIWIRVVLDRLFPEGDDALEVVNRVLDGGVLQDAIIDDTGSYLAVVSVDATTRSGAAAELAKEGQ